LSASRPCHFTPGEKYPGTHCADHKTGLDDMKKLKFLTLLGLEFRPLVVHVASRYTDYANAAHTQNTSHPCSGGNAFHSFLSFCHYEPPHFLLYGKQFGTNSVTAFKQQTIRHWWGIRYHEQTTKLWVQVSADPRSRVPAATDGILDSTVQE
jgi:hypothetical protein